MSDTPTSIVEPLIPIARAKKILGISWPLMRQTIREGKIPAYSISGKPISLADISEETRGLRVKPSDLRAHIESLRVPA